MNKLINGLKLKYFFMTNSVVVIESDDWGYASMYDKSKYINIAKYINNFKSPYAYHAIEDNDDLNKLYETCISSKDSWDQSLVITANFIVKKPNFSKIIQSNYQKVYFDDIDISLYNKAIKNNIIFPQFHGKHHYNVLRWKFDLQHNLNNSRELCQNNIFVLNGYNINLYNGENAEVTSLSIIFHKKKYLNYLIKDGMKKFQELFGFESKSVIAPSYYKNNVCEEVYSKNGVKYIQGDNFSHLNKYNGKLINKKTFLGNKSNGLVSLVRNVIFEPSHWFFQNKKRYKYNKNILYLSTRKEIYFGNPLIVCSHSYNYVGSLNKKMRNFSLKELSEYINYIKSINAKTIFLNSVQLGELLENGKIKKLKIDINKINYFYFVLNLVKSKFINLDIIIYRILKRLNK